MDKYKNYKLDYEIHYCGENKDKKFEFTEEDEKIMKEKAVKYDYLASFGVYPGLYTSEKSRFPVHPDGIHHYRKDAGEAIRLVLKENKELPEDLKERLLYYKSIMDKEREEYEHRKL